MGDQQMQAARFEGAEQIRVETISVPEPGPGEVRVRLEGCGVCASNLPPFEGREWFRYPLEAGMPGHEGWGQIDAIGEGVTDLSVGDRVAMLSNHAYAEYDVAPAAEVALLPSAVSSVPFPGEPLGCALNVFRRSDIQAGQTVAVVGVGFLGAMLVRLAARAGARVIAITRRPFALEVAHEFGAAETIPMEDHWHIIERVKALTGGEGCERVIEAVGKQWPLDLASELTRVRGRLVIAGYHQDGPRQVNMQQWNWRGLDVINAHERDPQVYVEGMRAAVDAVLSGTLDPLPLFTHRYHLDDLGAALTATRERPDGFMKALVVYD
jgi:threonine dehydrogenase-like Zn-dependent dehydrogenase